MERQRGRRKAQRFANGASLVLEASWAANIREAELMETRLLGTQAGLLQHNLGEGYDFDAHIYFEQGGTQFDQRLHPTGAVGASAMHDYAQAILTDTPHPAPGEAPPATGRSSRGCTGRA